MARFINSRCFGLRTAPPIGGEWAFLSLPSASHKFLTEFLEVGGVLTVVEILGVRQAREVDKAECLKLLTCIASAGRHYKEIICQSYGMSC